MFSLFAFSKIYGRSPAARFYSFYAPCFEKLIPFNPSELEIIKNQKIKSVIHKFGADYTSVYKFNEAGQVYFQKNYFFSPKKKKFILSDSIEYKYDNNGRIVVRNEKGHVNNYDSLCYNSKGKVIYYLSNYSYKSRKKTIRHVDYELVVETITDLFTTLVNKADTFDNTKYIYDQNNQIQKVYNKYNTDSIGLVKTSEADYCVKYYYKNNPDSMYKVGQEFLFKNKRLIKYLLYDEWDNGKHIHKTTDYVYSDEGILVQEIGGKYSNTKKSYFYNSYGLIEVEQISEGNSFSMDKYFYWYTKDEYSPH